MANLKEVRNRIASVKSTQQITKAMKMVSAAKLRRAQGRIVQLRPYAEKLTDILANLSASLDEASSSVYAEQRELKKVLIVPITSNRGLCGAFNSNVLKRIQIDLKGKFADTAKAGNVDYLCIGKKGYDVLIKKDLSIIGQHNDLFNDLTFDNVNVVASAIMKAYAEGKYDHVELYYNKFKNPVVQILTAEQFLPIVKAQSDTKDGAAVVLNDYIMEPSAAEIIEDIIPKTLKIQLYKALLDSNASEHGARMSAMDQATDNADDLLRSLKIAYNRARQAAITTELAEIVAGANAL